MSSVIPNSGYFLDFNPDRRSDWGEKLGIEPLDNRELTIAFGKARKFILQKKDIIASESCWECGDLEPDDSEMLYFFAPASENNKEAVLCLPKTLSSIADDTKKKDWFIEVFQNQLNIVDFNEFETSISRDRLPSSLLDIVFILQCLAPGMLLVSWRVDTEKENTYIYSRGLPPVEWIEKNSSMLREILCDKPRFERLRISASDDAKAVINTSYNYDPPQTEDHWIDWDDRDDYSWQGDPYRDGVTDYEYCSLECGYCGKCAAEWGGYDPDVNYF